jgi:hypothetical protein
LEHAHGRDFAVWGSLIIVGVCALQRVVLIRVTYEQATVVRRTRRAGSLAVGRATLYIRAAPLRDLEASPNREERRSNITTAARSTPEPDR